MELPSEVWGAIVRGLVSGIYQGAWDAVDAVRRVEYPDGSLRPGTRRQACPGRRESYAGYGELERFSADRKRSARSISLFWRETLSAGLSGQANVALVRSSDC
jgi:hypothetical protein